MTSSPAAVTRIHTRCFIPYDGLGSSSALFGIRVCLYECLY
jgi:hypothetical protein